MPNFIIQYLGRVKYALNRRIFLDIKNIYEKRINDMAKYLTENIRNVAIIGHSGEGKTSLAEAILYNAKATDRLGKTTDGNTVMDFDEQEIARGISISLSVANLDWNGVKINLVDVPGFYDFEGEFEGALRAVGSAVLVADASGQVAVGAEKAIDYCIRRHIPLMIFVNGVDKENETSSPLLESTSNDTWKETYACQYEAIEKCCHSVSIDVGRKIEECQNG